MGMLRERKGRNVIEVERGIKRRKGVMKRRDVERGWRREGGMVWRDGR